jgi:hypothetical protein
MQATASTGRRGGIDEPGRRRSEKAYPRGVCISLLKSLRAAVDIAVDNFVDNSVGWRELGPGLCGYLVGRRRYSCGPEVPRWLCFT